MCHALSATANQGPSRQTESMRVYMLVAAHMAFSCILMGCEAHNRSRVKPCQTACQLMLGYVIWYSLYRHLIVHWRLYFIMQAQVELFSIAVLMVQAVAMFSPQVTNPELVVCDNVTGVACSADGRHVLANYLNNHVYMFSIDGVGLGAAPTVEASPSASPRRARRDSAAQGDSPLSWSVYS